MKKIFKSEYFPFAKQVKFLDLDVGEEEIWRGGIVCGDKLICGCCGAVSFIEEFFEDWDSYGKKNYPNVEAPIRVYENWVDINEEIAGE